LIALQSVVAVPLKRAAVSGVLSVMALLPFASPGAAQACPGHPGAVGTTRVIAIDPRVYPRVGTLQFPQTLPLRDREVVLTFDDGPSPETTAKVLDALAAECVRANFFMLGVNAKASPDLVRRAFAEGHTVGTHSQTHPSLAELPLTAAEKEITDGFDSANAALGEDGPVAPFFRAPYLVTTPALDDYLVKRGIMLWSIDVDPEDWRPQRTPEEVVTQIVEQLEKKRSGIVLMHDVQPHTAAAVPMLLSELKARGYTIAHVVYGKAEEAAAR
jgi:peptidoglycan/xylan/chitin deacetylase (PgdA/CDA1 family)